MIGEYIEEGGVYEGCLLFNNGLALITQDMPAGSQCRDDPGKLHYFRKIIFHGRSNGRGGGRDSMLFVSPLFHRGDHPVDIFCILMMQVITILILDIKNYIKTA